MISGKSRLVALKACACMPPSARRGRVVCARLLPPLTLAILLLMPSLSPAEVYKYINKDGVVSYTDSLQAVPEKYREKATVVKGLREKGDKPADMTPATAASATAKQEAPQIQPPQSSIPVRQQIEKRVQDITDKGYWKPVVVILAFIAVFVLLGKAGDLLGHKGLWTVLRILVVLGLMSYFLYAYIDEMSGVYNTMSDRVYSIKGRIDKRHGDESRQQNDVLPDIKRQGEKK
jgi:hypothetical protein